MVLSRRTLIAALAIAAGRPARANDPATAAAFIETRGRALKEVLDSDSPLAEKRDRVAAILREAVDVRGVAQFVLGRHWRTASEAERAEYLSLFEATLIRNLSARFGELRGLRFAVTRAQPRGEEGVLVTTMVEQPGQAPVQLDWLVSFASGRPLIVDLVAEGTSLRITQRSEYGAVIQRGGGRLESLCWMRCGGS
ncbi:MAG: ABC transporter substrate-binding protein [Acetobacteraceae bacterium]|nr:ABC transporter substrate-binding protein [Acetobacteraceae bacterium]